MKFEKKNVQGKKAVKRNQINEKQGDNYIKCK